MPGKRDFQQERLDHAETFAARAQQYVDLMRRQLPDKDLPLIGWNAILSHLASLNISRPNGQPLDRHILLHWRKRHGFPVARGFKNTHVKTPPLTTTFAVTGWLLASFSTAERYRVGMLGPAYSHPAFTPTSLPHDAPAAA